MKVCPQCEFIYEDDQRLCDMEGAELVYDPAPRALAVASDPAGPMVNSRWRRFETTAVIGVVLGIVLVLSFDVFTLPTQEQLSTTASQKTNHSSEQVTGESAVPPNLDLSLPVPVFAPVDAMPVPVAPPAEALPAPAAMASPESPSPQPMDLSGPGAKATSKASSVVKLSPEPSHPTAPRLAKSTRKPQRAGAKPREANHKESGIGTFLKKTGRILKKPFRF